MNMVKSSAFCFIFLISVASCQFFYNYEEERPDEPQPETQSYDQSTYQYNPPSAVNQQYLQSPSNENQPVNEREYRRTRIRVRSRNYQSDPDYNEPQSTPVVESEDDQRKIRQERRQARRRQRENDYMVQTAQPPRILGPSIFENVGLGEPPTGVYIPSDSFLNVLRNQRSMATSLIPQPVVAVPQTTHLGQPSIANINSRPRFFVQPQSNDEPKESGLILPVTRPEVQYTNPSAYQLRVASGRRSPSQARSMRGNTRSPSSVSMRSQNAVVPTVDIDALRETRDDMVREDVMQKIPYVRTNIRPISRSPNRRRQLMSYQEPTLAPKVYSPSIFENVGLGEAPSGVYVPEDSLLNVLRNPSGLDTSQRVSRNELSALPAPQPVYSVPNEYEEEYVEEQYQLPPTPAPARTRTPPRSRPVAFARRSQKQEYQNESDEYQDYQPVQTSSQRRRADNYEDFDRQKLPAPRRTQSHGSPVAASVPRAQPQSLQSATSGSSQSTIRKAKLAIAELPQDTDDDGIPGEAGVNYPTLHVIPKTSFSCFQQPHNGYYADLETSCQVVHLCQSGGVQSSFLCPNGTIFSQEKFSCQWWYKVNCNDAPKYYVKNDELYKVPEKIERRRN